jgi:hypothetical protein
VQKVVAVLIAKVENVVAVAVATDVVVIQMTAAKKVNLSFIRL